MRHEDFEPQLEKLTNMNIIIKVRKNCYVMKMYSYGPTHTGSGVLGNNVSIITQKYRNHHSTRSYKLFDNG